MKKARTEQISNSLKDLINKRNQLVKNEEFGKETEEINKLIASLEAKENRDKIMKNFEYFSENPEKIQVQKMWKSLKNICPKLKPTLPSAKRNLKGKIVSSQKDIKQVLAAEYKNRLRTRPMRNDLKSVKYRKNKIFNMKMNLSKLRKSKSWTVQDLELALKGLKNNKSRDYEGYVNEIFKNGVIGSDLKRSLLIMFNNLKKENMIPQFMNFANQVQDLNQ